MTVMTPTAERAAAPAAAQPAHKAAIADDMAMIRAIVPLAEVSNYQGQLKSVTGGLGTFTMDLSHYDPVPSHVMQQIVAEYKPQHDED